MKHTENSIKDKHWSTILLQRIFLVLQIATIIVLAALAVWLGNLAMQQLEMTTPSQPQMIPQYITGSAICFVVGVQALLWTLMLHKSNAITTGRAEHDLTFMYFAKKWFKRGGRPIQRCQTIAELTKSLVKAGVRVTDDTLRMANDLDKLMSELSESELKERMEEIDGFGKTIKRKTKEVRSKLKAERKRVKKYERLCDELRATLEEQRALKRETANLEAELNGVTVLKQPQRQQPAVVAGE